VIDHAGNALHVTADRDRSQRSASDHANPVIDHYALSGALSPSMTDTVSADADPISDYADPVTDYAGCRVDRTMAVDG
jgi:hypothetical protein